MNELTLLDTLILAEAAGTRERPFVRTRILVVALWLACRANKLGTAEACRQAILAQNPGHLLSHWTKVEEAAADEQFQLLAESMGRKYPRERVERLLQSLELEATDVANRAGGKRELVARILGVDPSTLGGEW